MSSDYVSLICPDGPTPGLRFELKELKASPFIKGTVIDKVFLSNDMLKQSEINLTYEFKIVKELIPLIREGKLYNTTNEKDKSELVSLLSYLAGDNELWNRLSISLLSGTMHKFGYKLSNDILFFDSNVIPYNEKISEEKRKQLLDIIKLVIDQLEDHKKDKENKEFKRMITIHWSNCNQIYFSVTYKSSLYRNDYYYLFQLDGPYYEADGKIRKVEADYKYIYTKLDELIETF